MQKIFLENMILTNFISHKKTNFNVEQAGILIITGKNLDSSSMASNGSGKSLLIDALVWLLYGKTLRNINIDDIIGEFDTGCQVSGVFSCGNDYYMISRNRNFGDLANKVFFGVGDGPSSSYEFYSNTKSSEVNSYIEKWLGLSYESFKSICVMGQATTERFIYMTSENKQHILGELLDFERIDEANKNARDKIKNLLKEEKKIELNLKSVEARIDILNSDIDKISSDFEDYNEQLFNFLNPDKDNIHNLEYWLNEYGPLIDEGESFFSELNELTEDIRIKTQEIEDVEDRISEEHIGISYEYNKYVKLRENRSLIAKEYKQIKESCVNLRNSVDSKCTICYGLITDDNVDSYEKEQLDRLAYLRLELKKMYNMGLHIRKGISFKQDASQGLSEGLNKLKLVKQGFENKRTICLDNIGEVRLLKEEYIKKEALVDKLTQNKDHLEDNISNKQGELEDKKIKLEQSKVEEFDLCYALDSLKREVFLLGYWVDGFGSVGIKHILLEKLIEEFNGLIAYYANMLFDNEFNIMCVLRVNKKSGESKPKLDIQVGHNNKKSRSVYSFSFGEKNRINLCVEFALRSLINTNVNFAFLDEPMLGLDNIGRERTMELLYKEMMGGKRIILIDNTKDMPCYWDKAINIVKQNDVSFIEG